MQVTPNRSDRPPAGPVSINWGHHLSQGLTGLWVFNGAAQAASLQTVGLYNAVYGNTPYRLRNTSGYAQNSHGPALMMSAASPQWIEDLCGASSYLRSLMIPTARITVLMIRNKTDTTLRTGNHFGISGGTTFCTALCPYTDSKIYWDFGGNTGDNRLTSSALTWTTDVDVLGFVAGARGMAIYRNGTQVAVKTPAVTRTDGGTFSLNGSSDKVDVNFFAILNAEWLPSQMLEWMANPYALLLDSSWPLVSSGSSSIGLMNRFFRGNQAVQRASSW